MNIKLLISHQKLQVHALKNDLRRPFEERTTRANDSRLKGELACAENILRVLNRAEEFAHLIEASHG